MVNRLFRLINKEFGGLHEAALLLAFATLLSQILALARDRLLAGTFGAGESLDIYYSAFRVPDFLYATIASFISVTVVIPLLVEQLEKGDKEGARDFLSALFTIFSLVMAVASGLVFLFSPYLVDWLVPGFSLEAKKQVLLLSRILLLSPFLLGLSNLLGSVTQTYRKFLVFSLSPVLYNLGIIAGLIFLTPYFGLVGLVLGVLLGAVAHLAIQLPTLFSIGLWPRWSWVLLKERWHLVYRLILISWPRTLTLSSNQLVILALVAIASYLGAGAIAIFNFSFNLQSVPLAIVGVSYSVAAFPSLTQFFASGQLDKFRAQILLATRHIIFWALPTLFLFVILRAQIVRVILGSGRFDWTATRLTAAALALFALSVVAQSLILLLVRGYYASGRTWKPLLANFSSALTIIALAFVFCHWFRTWEAWRLFWENVLRLRHLPGTIIVMLPLAYTLGTFLNCFILLVSFSRDYSWSWQPVWRSFKEILVASVLGGVVTYSLLNYLGFYLELKSLGSIFSQGFLAGLGGILTVTFLLYLLDNQELKEVVLAIRHKFWRGETLVPEQSEL